MFLTNPQSINDLVKLSQSGVPVTLTSHPGNASLYKLTLWACGIQEHLWDITCCIADANNWPMHRLCENREELLVSEDLFEKITKETLRENQFVVAYQFAKNGTRLGRYHVQTMQQHFPKVISSCSRLLLSQEQKVYELFEFLAETRNDVFTRFITPEGVMRSIHQSGVPKQEYATSFMGLLKEVDHLLLEDNPIQTKGGVCYGGVSGVIASMLVDYWNTGETVRYDISGPDMIHYFMKASYQAQLSEMLEHIRKWNPALVPKRFITQMIPGTYARVGHVERPQTDTQHISKLILERKRTMMKSVNRLSKEEKRRFWDNAKDDESHWPIHIVPNEKPYFSQYDLLHLGGSIVVDEYWKNIPIPNLLETLRQGNALLHIR